MHPVISKKKGEAPTRALTIALSLLLVSIFFPTLLFAERMDVSPTTGSYVVGRTFPMRIFLSTEQAVNAVSGEIKFSADKLEVVSLSKTDSIVNLWVQEPSFSNETGRINLEGVILNPGYTGTNGRILTVNFRAKATGTALVSFANASTLANNGEGTNILKSSGTASYLIANSTITPTPEPPPLPVGLAITSSTHPDQSKWYQSSDPEFSWRNDRTVTEVFLSFGRRKGTPTVSYIPPVSSKSLDNVEDGVWYFNVQQRTDKGLGTVASFRFQIDSVKPEFLDITELARADRTDPVAKFRFNASDAMSGVDYFDIQIDDAHIGTWPEDKASNYATPPMGPGKHTLLVKAVDRAGNYLVNTAEFVVEPIETPIIKNYNKELGTTQLLSVEGTAKPGYSVKVYVTDKENSEITAIGAVDRDGDFLVTLEAPLKSGAYKLWAEAVDTRGARSLPTEKYSVKVRPSAFVETGTSIVRFLTVLIPLLGLVLLLILMLMHFIKKMREVRRTLRKEIHDVEDVVHKSFADLKRQVKEQIGYLEAAHTRRQLTVEENRILKQLKAHIDAAEKVITKEVEHVKDDIDA